MEFSKRRALLAPLAATSAFMAVVTAAGNISTSLVAGKIYLFTCDTDCYIRQGGTAAAAAANSFFVPAGMPVLIDGGQGATLSAIRKATDGVATLQEMTYIA